MPSSPEKRAAQARAWKAANPDYYKSWSQKQRLAAIDYLGGACVRCNFDDIRALQFDHVNGGGSKEYKSIGNSGVRKRILNGEPGYQLLCANCNWIKRFEEKEN